MKNDPFKRHQWSIRVQGYDYSQAGVYFVTLCAYYERIEAPLALPVVFGSRRLAYHGEGPVVLRRNPQL